MFSLFVPQTCLHCAAHIGPRNGADPLSPYLCVTCLREYRMLEPPSRHDLLEKRNRFSDLNAHVRLGAGYLFGAADGLVQSLVHHAKYNSMMQLAQLLGIELATRLPASFVNSDLIVPVPLHRTRRAERGYNQAEQLARGIAQRTGIPVAPRSLLRRIKQTPTQTGLDHEAREENVRGAFRLGPHATEVLKGKRVILVDDVMTTGATLASAANEIDVGEPSRIEVVAFSLALPQ